MKTEIEIDTEMDSKVWSRHLRFKVMEAEARIQRDGLELEARGFTIYFESE